MENKLMSMVDYVIKCHNIIEDSIDSESKMYIYANFLKQPLTLGMFVPCDLDGNVLEEPKFENIRNSDLLFLANQKYQEAKERVIFEGFKVKDRGTYFGLYLKEKIIVKIWKDDLKAELAYKYYTSNVSAKIEDLVKYKLTLTPKAIR